MRIRAAAFPVAARAAVQDHVPTRFFDDRSQNWIGQHRAFGTENGFLDGNNDSITILGRHIQIQLNPAAEERMPGSPALQLGQLPHLQDVTITPDGVSLNKLFDRHLDYLKQHFLAALNFPFIQYDAQSWGCG